MQVQALPCLPGLPCLRVCGGQTSSSSVRLLLGICRSTCQPLTCSVARPVGPDLRVQSQQAPCDFGLSWELPPKQTKKSFCRHWSGCLIAPVTVAVGVMWRFPKWLFVLAITPSACTIVTDHQAPRGPGSHRTHTGQAPWAQPSGGVCVIASLLIAYTK